MRTELAGGTQGAATRREAETYELLGVAHRILVSGEQSAGAATMVEVTVPQGAGVPLHTNEREAIVWCVVDGILGFHLDGDDFELGAGEAVYMEPGSAHAFANPTQAPARAMMVAVPGGIEGFFRDAAAVLPAGAPSGPPPPEAMEALGRVAGRYGISLNVPGSSL